MSENLNTEVTELDGSRARVKVLIPADEVAALAEPQLFELCCSRIRELDASARATRSGTRG